MSRRKAPARVRVRDYVPGATLYFGQCPHVWALRQEKPGEVCADCGAICQRDPKTRAIIEFDANPARGEDL